MPSSPLPELSDALKQVIDLFADHRSMSDNDVITIGGDTLQTLLAMFRRMHNMAVIQEKELGALRLLTLDGDAKRVVCSVLSSTLSDLKQHLRKDGNIIRPDFSRK